MEYGQNVPSCDPLRNRHLQFPIQNRPIIPKISENAEFLWENQSKIMDIEDISRHVENQKS